MNLKLFLLNSAAFKIFSSIPTLYPLNAHSTHCPPSPTSHDNQKHLQQLPSVPWRYHKREPLVLWIFIFFLSSSSFSFFFFNQLGPLHSFFCYRKNSKKVEMDCRECTLFILLSVFVSLALSTHTQVHMHTHLNLLSSKPAC